MQFALHPLLVVLHHVVAQIIEAKFIVCPIHHIGGVSFAALAWSPVNQARVVLFGFWVNIGWIIQGRIFVGNQRRGHTERVINRPHPAAADLRQIIVDRDQVYAASAQSVEIHRQRRDQRFAFASFHFGDPAFVQHDSADQLHIIMALADGTPRRFAHQRKRFGQQFIQRRIFNFTQLLLIILFDR